MRWTSSIVRCSSSIERADTLTTIRARVYQDQNKLELAERKNSRKTYGRTETRVVQDSRCYQRCVRASWQNAIEILEKVICEEMPACAWPFPTLGSVLVQG